MQLIIAPRYIKQFAKTLQCLSKIGEDLYIQATEESIKFITVNSAKSTYVEVNMQYGFLEAYHEVEQSFGMQYKLRAKQCYQMFSSIKNVEKCAINISSDNNKVNFHMLCKNNIQKHYGVNCELATCSNALYSKNTPHRLSVKPKVLNDCLSFFSGTLEEISFQIQKDRFILRSYSDSPKKSSNIKSLQTEVNIDYADFDQYLTDGSNTEISFSFKDLKTIMAYCDSMNSGIDMYISQSGDPFHIHFKLTQNFEIDFVIATILMPSSQPSSQSSTNQQQQQQQQQQSSSSYQNKSYSYNNNNNNNSNQQYTNTSQNRTPNSYNSNIHHQHQHSTSQLSNNDNFGGFDNFDDQMDIQPPQPQAQQPIQQPIQNVHRNPSQQQIQPINPLQHTPQPSPNVSQITNKPMTFLERMGHRPLDEDDDDELSDSHNVDSMDEDGSDNAPSSFQGQ
ncbi:component of 9-1-1 complex [Tieghemostelium lacteum]|uniref:Component of 9-1-1 complex n=1 Tax=Tieghemostelium lacteum TaxID=361077 RepID=A0A152A470_TIELA|nr:component of 9-1-1 complex [Tieghemostelium lacteum]|eukprot:KYR01030.1 component of 9-1-1 complex [Tieghemostelium lacteum]